MMDRKIENPKVNEILTSKVFTLKPEFTIEEAVKFFNEYRLSSAPVVNNNNEILGYLSEIDCIKSLCNNLFYDESKNITVNLIMNKDVAFADGHWDIFELECFFVSHNLRSAPVVENKRKLIGIVTRRDILKALERIMYRREEYKKEIKTPVEQNMREKIRIILNRFQ